MLKGVLDDYIHVANAHALAAAVLVPKHRLAKRLLSQAFKVVAVDLVCHTSRETFQGFLIAPASCSPSRHSSEVGWAKHLPIAFKRFVAR